MPRRRLKFQPPPPPGPPETIQLESFAFGGEALGRVDGRVTFVPYGLPGETVIASVTQDKKDYARAEILEVIERSPSRTEPVCPQFGVCGGCQLQHALYPAQLEMKRAAVVEQLRRIGGISEAEALTRPTIGMVSPWEYRNHARFSVGRRYGELGFTQRNTRRLLRIEHCYLMHPGINQVLHQLQGRLVGFHGHQLAIRMGAATGDRLVGPALPDFPDVPSGQEYLEEAVLNRRYRVASAAFFQVNTRREQRPIPDGLERWSELVPVEGLSMADILALLVFEGLDPRPEDLVLDAYCGVGTFSTLLAPFVHDVIGIEESAAAVHDAEQNARDVPNARFVAGKVERILPGLTDVPTAVVLDPARVGCERPALDALADIAPDRLVYVSCDPATLARDLAILRERGFTLQSVQPVDMFPQTYHVENVAVLRR